MNLKKYLRKRQVYFGDTVFKIKKIKKDKKFFYVYIDSYTLEKELYCIKLKTLKWERDKDGIERIQVCDSI